MHHDKTAFRTMKTAIVLFTLFFQVVTAPKPSECCTHRVYSFVYNETAEDDPNHSTTDAYFAADWDLKLMISQDGPDQDIIIQNYQELKVYTIKPGQSCVWVSMPANTSFPKSTCLPSDAVFVGYHREGNENLQIWNYTNPCKIHFTTKVLSSNCIPREQRIELPSGQGPPNVLLRRLSYCQLSIASEKRNIPSNCIEATS